MTTFVPVEKCTIREIGGTLYVRIPSIIKNEQDVTAGDVLVWMRTVQNESSEREMFGAQIEKADLESKPS